MSNHTPGPWIIRKSWAENGQLEIVEAAAEKRCKRKGFHALQLAVVGDDEPDYPKTVRKNARLIAAAPDLLAALQELVGWKTTAPSQCVDAAKKAIAKATGESHA